MTNVSNGNGANRRALLAAAAALPLSGCDFAPYGISLSEWKSTLAIATGIEKSPDFARQQVEQIPFATIGYRIGNSQQSVLILAEKSGDKALWTSSQRLALTTANGRILQTSGFRWNLGSTNFIEPDILGTPQMKGGPQRKIHRLCDFPDISKFQIPIASEFEEHNEENITILGSEIATTRFTEHCYCNELDWNFDNFHWIDPTTGFVWQTAQYVHPNEAQFNIVVLRPPA